MVSLVTGPPDQVFERWPLSGGCITNDDEPALFELHPTNSSSAPASSVLRLALYRYQHCAGAAPPPIMTHQCGLARHCLALAPIPFTPPSLSFEMEDDLLHFSRAPPQPFPSSRPSPDLWTGLRNPFFSTLLVFCHGRDSAFLTFPNLPFRRPNGFRAGGRLCRVHPRRIWLLPVLDNGTPFFLPRVPPTHFDAVINPPPARAPRPKGWAVDQLFSSPA